MASNTCACIRYGTLDIAYSHRFMHWGAFGYFTGLCMIEEPVA